MALGTMTWARTTLARGTGAGTTVAVRGRGRAHARSTRGRGPRARVAPVARSSEEEGETAEAVDANDEDEDIVDVEETIESEAHGEESELSKLLGQLDVVVGDNAEAREILALLKTEMGDANAKMVGMEDQVGAMKDQYLRLNADFDNFRKRTAKEKADAANTAKGAFVKAMLPVLDNFDLAEKNIKGNNEGEEKILTGYQNIVKQMYEIFESQGLVTVPGVGEKFDPMDHEAIMREETDEVEEETIIEEFRKGYKIGDSLIRPSMVKVSTKP
ncbi:GrpE-domain-containing protein [Ostreococcus tauri]|uniref:GrpE protein homolog n=1 Tax=Ostreococcus tauri TaxID=70448 RepID=A0A1Y5IBL7_OSTTA|nr:GrpE-domain-containing protein [Ostreococcus tauri]